ncbi:hypothetical protein, partial [Burkholderia ambifaria]|uniref:hypothetical protein n=1 Tax=Burkholderia ambifaria TaxID=152480 RepID=UPI001ABB8B66
QFRVQVQALARLNRHFFLAFAWHKVAPWPSVYASHTKVRIGSTAIVRLPHHVLARMPGRIDNPVVAFLFPIGHGRRSYFS